jgi:predicted  nucleic acid-binding Zn-ribbon protein
VLSENESESAEPREKHLEREILKLRKRVEESEKKEKQFEKDLVVVRQSFNLFSC